MTKTNINDLTIGDARELAALINGAPCEVSTTAPWCIGENMLIRTVTHYWVGRIVSVSPSELVLEEAAWIADTGRYSDSLKDGDFEEVEPVYHGRVIVGRGAVIDAVSWRHGLPREKK